MSFCVTSVVARQERLEFFCERWGLIVSVGEDGAGSLFFTKIEHI